MASLKTWTQTNYFKNMEKKTTQLDLYLKKNSSLEIIQLVSMANKVFGTEMEGIFQEIFQLDPRENTQHDGIRNGKKIEIKSARWHATGEDCNWQHLEPDYDYEFVMFTLVDFTELKVWMITKKLLMGELRQLKIVSRQGQQGWTVTKGKLEKYLTPIQTIEELDNFIQQNSSENRTSLPQTDV
jgi:hypothetical protein